MSYIDIFNQDLNLYGNTGMPTIDSGAAMSGLNQTTNTGLTAPATMTPGIMAPQVPGMTGRAAAPQTPGFFAKDGIGQFALGAIQTLGSLWNSFQQNKMAKESMKFQKEAFATNLANQEQSYNTALEDRINARYVTEGKSQAEADAYVQEHSL